MTENEKLDFTLSTRVSQTTKEKLQEKAEEAGLSVGQYLKQLIDKDIASPTPSEPIQQNEKELLKNIWVFLNEEAPKNEAFRAEFKKWGTKFQLPKVEINNTIGSPEAAEEKNSKKAENQEASKVKPPSLFETILAIVTEEKKEWFTKEFKKISKNRIKMKLDKNEDETIYHCIKYCIEYGAFFLG